MKHSLKDVAAGFDIPGQFVKGLPYGSGHINDTYSVWFYEDPRTVRYIFQRINHSIFKDVPALMDNVERVTHHLRTKLESRGAGDVGRRTLTLIPTREGHSFLKDADGLYWRVYIFVEGARGYDVIETTRQAREAAKAFGNFQRDLSDLPGPRLHETIPNFHHTRSRFDAFVKALEADTHGRSGSAREEIAFALKAEALVDRLLEAQATGKMPERITHNDTKLNNVLIDDQTEEGMCVIDLDTVMPGLALYDFGDMVRTATNTGKEDERDLSRIGCNVDMFEALAQGYLASAGEVLTDLEVELMPFSGKLITLEIGLRFLTDYLAGDVYFKTHRDGHNLDRCRTQFKLVQSIEENETNMMRIVERIRQNPEKA